MIIQRTGALLPLVFIVVGCAVVVAQPHPAHRPASPGAKAVQAARVNNLGVGYMNQQLLDKGARQFRKASDLDPRLVTARLNLGIALLNLQKLDAARPLLEEAVKLEPHNPYGWYNLGLLHKTAGRAKLAIAEFQRVLDIDPNDADSWYLLGSTYLQDGAYREAQSAFERALRLNPVHASAEYGLARAYQRLGASADARRHFTRFQEITQSKSGAPMGLVYGEQGKYSLAQESPLVAKQAPPAIRVHFHPTTTEAGLSFAVATAPNAARADRPGPGACFLDYDRDGKPDLFLADGGKEGGMALYHNLGNGRFADATRAAGLDPTRHGIACSAGDYDNDGSVDLAVTVDGGVLLLRNEKNGTFKDVTAASGIAVPGAVLGVTFVDYDHDGDLDLYVTRSSSDAPVNQMWRNNGNGTFTDVTSALEVGGEEASTAAVATDYNNDRAVDLLVTHAASPVIFANPREGKFAARIPWSGAAPSASVGVAVLDFNKDDWMDIAFTHAAAPGITLWRNENGRTFERVALPDTGWVKGWGVAAIDYDNDGWLDLVAAGETADGRGEVRLFRNLGPGGFKDVTTDVGLDAVKLQHPRTLVTGDYDGDGATDLLITQADGPPVLLRNQGGNRNHWLRLSLKGENDNKSAIGAKVEVFAGGSRQKWEIAGSSGYLGQNSTEIIAGLGGATSADIVRVLWPTGVLQDEVEIAADRGLPITELDRRGSSCPTLFVWDGRRYRLVADMLGAGVVGHWVGPGERNIPRPAEYVKLDPDAVRAHHGLLSFRLMEPMEEVVYIDRVQLLAVDHPSDVEVYPNEYFASNPPYPEFKVITSRDARPPAGAWDEHGHDLLPDLLAHRYVGDFEVLGFKGFTKPHILELDLGRKYEGGPLRLLMHGEIEYFYANGMYAADQAGIHVTAPYVEALDPAGKWVRVVDDMGFPAGLPRTMIAELSERLPRNTQRIRITTNLQIYWDYILVDRSEQNVAVRMTELPLYRADLRFHGYPRQIEDKPPGNVKYIYEQVSPTGPYSRQAGAYTRYGDVRTLLADFDDRVVVFGSGDELALDFDPGRLAPLPRGWSRDYFFLANGYEKDWDFYAATGDTVDPLPFRDMRSYPYPAGEYPLDRLLPDLLDYDTRQVSGSEPQGYSYRYRRKDSASGR